MSTALPTSLPKLVLTEEQAKTVLAANGSPVELQSASGARIGFANLIEERDYDGWTAEDIAVAKARTALGRPGKTTAEVLEYLHSLERE